MAKKATFTIRWSDDELVQLAMLGPSVEVPAFDFRDCLRGSMLHEVQMIRIVGVSGHVRGSLLYSCSDPTKNIVEKYDSFPVDPWRSGARVFHNGVNIGGYNFEPWDELHKLLLPGTRFGRTIPSYPHLCPRCRGPAYVGFREIDCQRKCGPR